MTGSIFSRCVPTTTSMTLPLVFESSDSPSCWATQPATATMRIAARLLLQDAKLAEPRIELLLSVLAHAAGVDDDHVGIDVIGRGLVARLVEQPSHALRVVDVHLTAERLDEVFPGHSATFAFAFRLLFTLRRKPKHLPGTGANRLRDRPAADHTADFFNTTQIVQSLNCRHRPTPANRSSPGDSASTPARLSVAGA